MALLFNTTRPIRERPNVRREAAWAVAGSLLFHGGLIALTMVDRTPQRAFSGGEGQRGDYGQAIEVSLVGGGLGMMEAAPSLAPSPKPQPVASPMAALMARLQPAALEPLPAAQRTAPQSLSQLLAEQKPANTGAGAGRAANQTRQADNLADSAANASRAGRTSATGQEKGDKRKGSGDLWAQVESCWRPRPSTVAVTLEITINDRGQLAIPPRILRPTGAALNDARLLAEALALEAVAKCAPYSPAAAWGNTLTRQVALLPPARSPQN